MTADITKKPDVVSPTMSISIATDKPEIVQPDQLISCWHEVMNDIREDRDEVKEVINNFRDMVMNEGDATAASKEALVNLLRMKSEIADKKTRVLDLLLRAFLKDRVPNSIAQKQVNQYKIEAQAKRELFNMLDAEETKPEKP